MIYCSNRRYATLNECKRKHPGVERWARYSGGWIGFFTLAAYNIWLERKK